MERKLEKPYCRDDEPCDTKVRDGELCFLFKRLLDSKLSSDEKISFMKKLIRKYFRFFGSTEFDLFVHAGFSSEQVMDVLEVIIHDTNRLPGVGARSTFTTFLQHSFLSSAEKLFLLEEMIHRSPMIATALLAPLYLIEIVHPSSLLS